MEDRELVQKLLAKDEQAYRYFYQTYRDKIYKAASYVLGYKDTDAEDITQEVFLTALQKLPQFEFRSSLSHWLHCICTYLCYKRVRKRKRMVASLHEELESIAEPAAFQDRDPAERERERQRMLELVEAQKKLLGEFCRNLLDLRHKEKKSYAELAEMQKVPMGTINSRVWRCLEALKKLVQQALKEGTLG